MNMKKTITVTKDDIIEANVKYCPIEHALMRELGYKKENVRVDSDGEIILNRTSKGTKVKIRISGIAAVKRFVEKYDDIDESYGGEEKEKELMKKLKPFKFDLEF
jgi:hypothetical protein